MPLFIPDGVKIYEADLDNLARAVRNEIAPSGLGVTAQAVPNMSVQIALGDIFYAGARVSVGAVASLAIDAADPANPRIDLVCWTSGTGIQKVTGVAAGTPKPPALPASSILLAYVSVAAAAVNIQNANITDRRWQQSQKTISGTLANRHSATLYAGMTYIVTDGADGYTIYISNAVTWTKAAAASLAAVTMPNMLLNGDLARRTKTQTVMAERFTDNTAWTSSSAIGVAGNVMTITTASRHAIWQGPTNAHRDARWSALFKMTNTSSTWRLNKYVDLNDALTTGNGISFAWGNGNLWIDKFIAGVQTTFSTTAQALTLNFFYWLELETQGDKVIGRIYQAGAAVASKAASTLVVTITATVADAAVAAGTVSLYSTLAASLWGGLNTGDGNVYIEMQTAESWDIGFTGTIGGLGVMYDEAADAGPIGVQFPYKIYVPATSRSVDFRQNVDSTPTYRKTRSIYPSTAYTASIYVKTTGASGAGAIHFTAQGFDASLGNVNSTWDLADAQEGAWTQKSVTATSPSTDRYVCFVISVNAAANRTGTFYFQLAQFEQASTVTAWRNAPEDGPSPRVWEGRSDTFGTTASTTMVEPDSRNLGMDIYLDRDCIVAITAQAAMRNNTLAAAMFLDTSIDGVAGPDDGTADATAKVANNNDQVTATRIARLAAGKHRIALIHRTSAGTLAWGDRPSRLIVSAVPGR